MKSMRKAIAILLAISLTFLASVFSVSAASVDELDSAVSEMLSAEGYSDRLTAFLGAMAIYNGLTDGEKTEAASLYAEMLELKSELDNIKEKADEFIELVATIADVTVGDRVGVIQRAEGLVVDQTYPA